MPELSLCNSKGRDAQVQAESVRLPVRFRWLDSGGRQATSVRLLKGPIDRDYDALLQQFGSPADIGAAMVAGDPELNPETAGMILRDTSRVYVNSDRQTVYSVSEIEIVRDPEGNERQRRPRKRPMPNIGPEQPLLWSGRFLPKAEVCGKFVMASKLQVIHVNGLTYDFLFEIARELEAKGSLLIVGAGPKANQPLILRRGAVPYRGFLEGRTRGDEYRLVLHLSNMELKAPDASPSAEVKPS